MHFIKSCEMASKTASVIGSGSRLGCAYMSCQAASVKLLDGFWKGLPEIAIGTGSCADISQPLALLCRGLPWIGTPGVRPYIVCFLVWQSVASSHSYFPGINL